MPTTKTKKPAAKPVAKAKAPAKPAPKASAKAKAPAKPAPKAKTPAKPVKAVAKPAPKAKAPAKPAPKAKAPAKPVKPAAKPVAKPAAKAPAKTVKAPAKPAPKAKAPAKPVKPAAKPAAKAPVKPAAKAPAKTVAKPAVAAKAVKPAVKVEAPAKGKAVKVEEPKVEKEVKGKKAPVTEEQVEVVEEVKKARKTKADAPAEGAEPVLTDRQKARERKAKEKALLKEFAAQQLGSEEQQELRRTRLKTLIKMGKSKGYLTHGEMNDVMSDELSDADALDTLISLLSDINITVYEQAPDAETLLLNENASAATTEEEAEEEAEAALSTVDSEFGRTTDPVRMYMREMGTVDLLTREGEIVIAKKIEAGLKDMVMALAACPVTIAEMLANVDKIASGEMEIDQFVDGLVDPNAEDIKLGPEEPEEDPDAEEGEDVGDDEGGGGGGGAAIAMLSKGGQVQKPHVTQGYLKLAGGGFIAPGNLLPTSSQPQSAVVQFLNTPVNNQSGPNLASPVNLQQGDTTMGKSADKSISGISKMFKSNGSLSTSDLSDSTGHNLGATDLVPDASMDAAEDAGANVLADNAAEMVAYRGGLAATGGKVKAGKGQKAVVKGDSLKNDKVPAELSEGEIVIPRHITMAQNAPEKAAEFVRQTLARRKK